MGREINVETLKEGKIYHIYNRTNGFEPMFIHQEDYETFLNKIQIYIKPVAEIYAYSLMQNHFHLLVKIKRKKTIDECKYNYFFKKHNCVSEAERRILLEVIELPSNSTYLSNQFSNMFNSYSKIFNLRHKRHGNFFERPFHRKSVNEIDYLRHLFFYIHLNPIRDNNHIEFDEAEWTSYHDIIKFKNEMINWLEIMEIFDGPENFKSYHQNSIRRVRERNDWIEEKFKRQL